MTDEENSEQPANPEVENPSDLPPNTSDDMIEKANVTARRLEEANAELKQLLDRKERLRVEETLGGRATAGTKKEVSKEEQEIAAAKKLLEGSGYEDMFDETKGK